MAAQIKTVKGENIVERTARSFDADAMFRQVALGFGGVPLGFVFIHNVRPARSLVKSRVTGLTGRLPAEFGMLREVGGYPAVQILKAALPLPLAVHG